MNNWQLFNTYEVSVIIPTLNASQVLAELLDSLSEQTIQAKEIVVIDSISSDGTIDIAREAGCLLRSIPRSEFQHGRARNLGAELANGEVLVFLTQDALPLNSDFLATLIRPLVENKASASTAKQIARPEASPLEKFARMANYPGVSFIRSVEDIESMGVMAYFFSNAASAVDRNVFNELGGFSEEVIVNEDMHFCAHLLQAGYRVAYQAKSVVYHSHDYSLVEQFQRNFDIGVFFSQASEQLGGIDPGGRGGRFALGQIRYLLETRAWYWVPRAMTESFLKYLGFSFGKRFQRLPRCICRAFSRQKAYWDRDRER
jgi:rhamnosyltransferase